MPFIVYLNGHKGAYMCDLTHRDLNTGSASNLQDLVGNSRDFVVRKFQRRACWEVVYVCVGVDGVPPWDGRKTMMNVRGVDGMGRCLLW